MMCRKESTVQVILFEKYRVERIVYESENATVYLVEHINMSARRIIKKILKKSIRQNSFYSEINILKTVKHPNIPIIYDQYEDESAFYIVEEYIDAPNLMDYIRERGLLGEKQAVDIGIKLCEIISYLHSQKPVPILFLDIQPKNILINKDNIFLVDFGNSYYLDETGKRNILLGTPGYAAPEQYRYEDLDERTDIYGIGAVLYFMVTGRSSSRISAGSLEFPNEISGKYKMIVRQCISEDMSNRFSRVYMIADNLSDLTNQDIKYSDGNKPLTISLVGTKANCGVTSIGLALASKLAKDEKRVIFEECNSSNHIRNLSSYYKLKYSGGYFHKNKNMLLKPDYGPQIILEHPCNIIIRDHGDKLINEKMGDVLIVVAETKPWQLISTIEVCKTYLDNSQEYSVKKIIILANSLHEQVCMTLWRSLGCVGNKVPYIKDVFCCDKVTEEYLEELIKALGNIGQGGEKDKKKTGLFKRFSKQG